MVCENVSGAVAKWFQILILKVDAQGYGIKITKSGVFGATIQKPKVAVCPSCGEISLYIQDTSKVED